MTNKGLMIVLSGPSGVGKDAVLEKFMPQNPRCVRAITTTTRQPRQGEEHGRDYFFVTRKEFLELAEKDAMLEYTEYSGNYYGSPKKYVGDLIEAGKNVVLNIEVNGALQVKKMHPEAVLIFIVAPSWTALEERLKKRGTESPEALKARLETAKFEISKAHEYDYIVINDTIEECSRLLTAVTAAAECKTAHMREFIEEVFNNA